MYRTPKNQRATYVYESRTGETFTLQPGEDGVTEADIDALHRADDAATNNEQKQHRKGRKIVREIISLDVTVEQVRDYEDPFESVLMRESISTILPEKQAKAVIAVWLDGMSVTEYAAQIGTTKANVSQLISDGLKKLKNFL